MLLFLTYLLVALGPVPKVVLCIGQDGHVALEADPAADCACPPETSSVPPECAACVDIPLLAGAGSAITGNLRPSSADPVFFSAMNAAAPGMARTTAGREMYPAGSLLSDPISGGPALSLPLRI